MNFHVWIRLFSILQPLDYNFVVFFSGVFKTVLPIIHTQSLKLNTFHVGEQEFKAIEQLSMLSIIPNLFSTHVLAFLPYFM